MVEHRPAPAEYAAGAVASGAEHSRAVVRCRADAVAAVSAALDVALPTQACRAAVTDEAAALWLGPDEWLLLRPGGLPAPELPAGATGSVVDVSHRQVAMLVAGPRAEEILASGCPLDVALPAFPVGMCTRTLFHKAEIVLWRTAPDTFHLEVWRSFSRYVEALLVEADRDG